MTQTLHAIRAAVLTLAAAVVLTGSALTAAPDGVAEAPAPMKLGRPAGPAGPLPPYPLEVSAECRAALGALGRPVSARFDGASLTKALEALTEESGLRFAVDEAADVALPPLSFSCANLAAASALRLLLEPAGLAFAVQGDGRVRVGRKSDVTQAPADSPLARMGRIVQLQQAPDAPAVEDSPVLADERIWDSLAVQRLSLSLQGARVSDALGAVRDLSGVNILLAEGEPDGPDDVDVEVHEAPLESVLREIGRKRRLGHWVSGGIVWVGPMDEADQRRAEFEKRAEAARKEREAVEAVLRRPVKADYADTPLPLILQDLSAALGAETATDPETWAAAPRVTLKAEGTLRDFLAALAKATGTFWLHRDGKIFLLKAAGAGK